MQRNTQRGTKKMGKTNRVPNQREVTVAKEPTDKAHKYTANNLAALDEAARRLQSKGGFKLYMYLAKNLNIILIVIYCFSTFKMI